MKFIGPPCQSSNFVVIETPWRHNGVPIRVTINQALVARFRLACRRAVKLEWKPRRIDSFNCRQIRGSTSWSRHAFASAWDFFRTGPSVPPPGGVWQPNDTFGEKFALVFEDLGFTWGGRWARGDFPHIEWSGNAVPALTLKERRSTYKKFKARGTAR